MIKKFRSATRVCLWLALIGFAGSAFPVDYVYRDVMGNTLPPAKCAAQADARTKATDPYTVDKYAKTFCEMQGYGWHVSERKSDGKLVCDQCGPGAGGVKFQCRMEDVVVACKRIRPGTVGLLPGKG